MGAANTTRTFQSSGSPPSPSQLSIHNGVSGTEDEDAHGSEDSATLETLTARLLGSTVTYPLPLDTRTNLLEFNKRSRANAAEMRANMTEEDIKTYREWWTQAKSAMLTCDPVERAKATIAEATATSQSATMNELIKNVGVMVAAREAMETSPGLSVAMYTILNLNEQEYMMDQTTQTLETRTAAAEEEAWSFMGKIATAVERERASAIASETENARWAARKLRASTRRRDQDASRMESEASGKGSGSTIFSPKVLLWSGLTAALSVAYLVSRTADERRV